jgi:hypothetical protein
VGSALPAPRPSPEVGELFQEGLITGRHPQRISSRRRRAHPEVHVPYQIPDPTGEDYPATGSETRIRT